MVQNMKNLQTNKPEALLRVHRNHRTACCTTGILLLYVHVALACTSLLCILSSSIFVSTFQINVHSNRRAIPNHKPARNSFLLEQKYTYQQQQQQQPQPQHTRTHLSLLSMVNNHNGEQNDIDASPSSSSTASSVAAVIKNNNNDNSKTSLGNSYGQTMIRNQAAAVIELDEEHPTNNRDFHMTRDNIDTGHNTIPTTTSNNNDNQQLQQLEQLHQKQTQPQLTSKAFNASLLLLCFGFAVYSVLNVDEGMTRGWSISEKAMRIPLDNWSSYESSLNQQPVFTKTMINVVIYLLGDWLSQTAFIQRNLLEFDAWRTLRNGLIGMVFGPLVHEYYEFSDTILPVEVGINRFYKILMDQTIYIFIKCNIYIVAVNMLAGESWEYSYETAKEKIRGIMFTAWKFWPLVHCVTYGAIPARHRILWVNCVDLFWNAILASMTSGKDDDVEIVGGDEDGKEVVTFGTGGGGGEKNNENNHDDDATLSRLIIDSSSKTQMDEEDIMALNDIIIEQANVETEEKLKVQLAANETLIEGSIS